MKKEQENKQKNNPVVSAIALIVIFICVVYIFNFLVDIVTSMI